MEPIEITTWQCPICKSVYRDKDEAIACSNLEASPHRFKVGDTVYIEERYPDDLEKPLVSVKISEVYGYCRDADKHVPQYLFKEGVRVGKNVVAGRPEVEYYEYGCRPAYEWEIYALGDLYGQDLYVTEDMIGEHY